MEGSFCKDFECKSTVSKLCYQSAQQPLPLSLPLLQLTATPSLGPSKQIMKTNANSRQQNTKQIAGDSSRTADANAEREREVAKREGLRQRGKTAESVQI